MPVTEFPVRQVTVQEKNVTQRLDNFLLTFLKGVPRSHVYRLLRKGEVRVNKKRVKAEYRLQEGDIVRIPPIRQDHSAKIQVADRTIQALNHRILYEDKDLIVLNKPAGMAVHGGSGVRFGVIEALRQRSPGAQFELVHRLDRDTSGCLLIAKKSSILRELHRMLREHEVIKSYYALVKGHWPKRLQQINQPLEKNILRSGERMVKVHAQGKESKTYFQVQKCFSGVSLVKARLETGRTHQIRVHAAFAHHPLAGDDKYGDKQFNQDMRQFGLRRLFLHAFEIKLRLPAWEEAKTFTAPLDEELNSVIQSLASLDDKRT